MIRNFLSVSFLSCLLTLLGLPASANDVLDTVTVQGYQQDTTSQFKQTLLRQDFIGRFNDLAEALQQMSGVQLRKSSPGNPASLSIRGSSHKQITFIVDGQIINQAQNGEFDINRIPIQQIQSIEIIQGSDPTSGVVQSIGGTIKIFTLSPNEQQDYIYASVGSFNSKQVGSNIGGSFLGYWNLSLDHSTTQANYDYPVPSPLDNPNDSGRIEDIRNNDYEKNSALLKWENTFEKISINANLNILKDKKNLPNYQMNSPFNHASLTNDSNTASLQFKWEIKPSLGSLTSLMYSESLEEYSDLKPSISFKPTNTVFNTTKSNITQKLNYSFSHAILGASISGANETFSENEKLIADQLKCKTSVSICDTAAEQQQYSTQLYFQHFSSEYELSANIGLLDLKRSQNNRFGPENTVHFNKQYSTWSFQFQYLNWQYANINLNSNLGIRTPTLYELFGDRGLVKSNLKLKPEESLNLSLDLDFQPFTFSFADLLISTGFYNRKLENAIIPIYSDSVGVYSNTSKANIIGWQNHLKLQGEYWQAGLQLVLQDSNTQSEYQSFDNKKLPGIYHKQASLDWNYLFSDNYRISINHIYSSELYLNNANTKSSYSNESTNVKASWQNHNLKISILLNNAFNREYIDQFNRPVQDRSLTLNSQYQF